MKRKISNLTRGICLALLSIVSYGLFAQNLTLKGTVVDTEGIPLAGVTLQVQDIAIGTITDTNGNFALLNIPLDAIIEVSYVGMSTQTILLNGRTTLHIVLQEDTELLDELIVIGYGTVRKSDLTGSVSSIKPDDVLKVPVSRVDQALQGRAAGVYVTSASNAPGGGTTIRIRGGNSITAGNEPLYVIDGIIGAPSNSISPSDIETIEVLKDASSTAIYGTRGANGVILITSKKGTVGKPIVTINSTHGWQEVSGKIDVRNGREFAEFYNNGAINTGLDPIYDLNALPPETDWQDVALRKGYITDNNISVRGGTEQTQYYVSGSFFKQEGIILANEFNKYNINFNLDQKISNFFKFGVSMRYNHIFIDNPKYGAGILSLLNPLLSVYDENGDYTYMWESGVLFDNPIAAAEMNIDETINDRVTVIANSDFKILPGLNFNTSFSYDLAFNKDQIYLPGSKPNRAAQNAGGFGSISNNRQTTLLNENIIVFNKELPNSNFNAIAGVTFQTFTGESSFLSADKLINDVTKFYALEFSDAEFRAISSGYNEWSIASFLSRVNYSLANKYLFTATFRRDGSSRIGKNNKWANFPSGAFAWRLSEEPFIENLRIFDNLKLRASYGITGNQGIPTFITLPRLGTLTGVINNNESTGVIQGTLENPNIRWETTQQYDLGLELGLFKNRLSLDLDFYYKKTNDLLFDVEVPHFTGFITQLQNVGSLQNYGFDALVDARIITERNFEWRVTANISQYNNKILDLGEKNHIDTYRLPAPSRALTGKLIKNKPLGVFVGYVYDGIDSTTGDMVFKDLNDDGVIDEKDETIIGDSNPKSFGGIQNNFRYKNFGLNIFFQGVFGNDLYNTRLYNSSSMEVGGHELNSYRRITPGQWTKDNPDGAEWPGAGIANNILIYSNSKFIQNGSFIRLKSLELSYTLPSIGSLFEELQINFTGSNLFLIKDKDFLNYDPEVSEFGTDDVQRGYDNVVYPNNRSYVFGVQITF